MPKKKNTATSLQDLLVMKLQALYDIELQLIKALPKMVRHATDSELKDGFEKHLTETEGHAERLEEAFAILGEKAKKMKVEAIRGLVMDADWLFKNIKDTDALDASLIAAGQYVEHYEMAGYGAAKEWAKLLGLNEIEDLLTETLNEEKAADRKLNELATERINDQAAASMGRAML